LPAHADALPVLLAAVRHHPECRSGPRPPVPDARWRAARAAGDLPLHNHAFRLADGHCTTGEWSLQAYQVAVEDSEVVPRR
jgi:hypothetical protein